MLLKMGVVVCKRYRCTEVADNEEEEMVAVLTAPPPLMADGRRISPIIFISLGLGRMPARWSSSSLRIRWWSWESYGGAVIQMIQGAAL